MRESSRPVWEDGAARSVFETDTYMSDLHTLIDEMIQCAERLGHLKARVDHFLSMHDVLQGAAVPEASTPPVQAKRTRARRGPVLEAVQSAIAGGQPLDADVLLTHVRKQLGSQVRRLHIIRALNALEKEAKV